MSQSIRQALQAAQASLPASGSPRLDAQVLLCHVLGCNSAHLAAWPEKELDQKAQQDFGQLLARRRQGLPIAYLTGEKEFWSRRFRIDENTLIPRPETEQLVEFLLERLPADRALQIADLGTGSGAIAITLACERPGWTLIAADTSTAALELAADNARRHGAVNVSCIRSDWLGNIAGPLDAIVSNPPYIPARDPHLGEGDVRYEPRSALVAGEDGLDAIRAIAAQAADSLRPGGWLVLEHGYDQQQSVAAILRSGGFIDLVQQRDTAGLPRLSAARRAA